VIRALAFDVFGTVVDWRASVTRELAAFGRRHDVAADWPGFADDWRAGYVPAMDRVRNGELPWTRLDDLHRGRLVELLDRAGITVGDTEIDELNRAWHRLDPWPDAVAGLTRLKRRFVITTLSNGNVSLLTNMAKRAGLPWDCVLSAEVFRHYKPDPETYLGVCDVFDIEPAQMLMAAAHKDDLHAAKACGCSTAYIERPFEFGSTPQAIALKDLSVDSAFDYHARDVQDLAAQLLKD
jgi:2-haloacid dehalogenase